MAGTCVTRVVSAQELLGRILDRGSFLPWDEQLDASTARAPAPASSAAAPRVATDASLVTGEGLVHGRRIALAVSQFGVSGGSVGVGEAQRLRWCIERATRERLPVVASPASGGTRISEGARAFVQMVDVVSTIARRRAAGLPYLVYLRQPSMGGVLASWGVLGQVTAAQPGALISLVGPRVREALGTPALRRRALRAEGLLRRGLIDAVVNPEDLRLYINSALKLLEPSGEDGAAVMHAEQPHTSDASAWEAIQRTRRSDRPGARELLDTAAELLPLQGGAGDACHPGLVIALARFEGVSCMVVAQDRTAQSEGHMIGPTSLSAARRAMSLAEELHIPLLTVIDTPGLSVAQDSEEGGIAWEVARCISTLAGLQTRTVSFLLGQGTGAGALALFPTDDVVCAQHAWLAPLAPEGSSAIMYRDPDRAPEMAETQGISGSDLVRMQIVDSIVAECPDAADEADPFLKRASARIARSLAARPMPFAGAPLDARRIRYRLAASYGAA